jgi:uncharacterized protein YndB with AHSA1/START domain
MKTEFETHAVETLLISRDIVIAAPIEIVFEAVLDELGPECQLPGGKPFPMKIEPWAGGRWFREVNNQAGHLWGHVQVIKPPTLIEICSPLMMSYPAINHIQYRLVQEAGATRLTFLHRGLGLFQQEHREGLPNGWGHWLERIRQLAEARTQKDV